MAIYRSDIADIELNGGNIHRSFLHHSIGSGDNMANRFGVRVARDGEPVDLTGVSCFGYFRNAEGTNIALTTEGTVAGNMAFVTLPQACYNVEGQFMLAIKLVGGGITGTMRIVDGVVDNTNTGGAVAPTEDVPTYTEILAVYEQMQEAVEDYSETATEQNARINYMPDGSFADFTDGQYFLVQNSKIDISSPGTGSGWSSAVVPCEFGDAFMMTARGVANPYTYAFIDSEGNVLTGDNSQTLLERERVTAPLAAAYLVVNNASTFVSKPTLYKYRDKTTPEDLTDEAERTVYANGLNYNVFFDGFRKEEQRNGVTFTPTKKGLKVVGTATGTFAFNLFVGSGENRVFETGKIYRVKSENLNNKAALQIIYQTTRGATDNVLLSTFVDVDTAITTPAAAPYMIRVSLVILASTSYNDEFVIDIHDVGYDGIYKTSWFGGSMLETIHAAQKKYGSLVFLDSGTYDVVEELIDTYGETFFTAYNRNARDGWGVELTNGVTVRGMSETVIECDPGEYQTESNNIRDYFSPFMLAGDCTIENVKIIAKNCKYCIHDDWYDKTVKAKHVVENCVLIKDDTFNRCYGSGFTNSSELIIRNCYFQDNTQAPVSIHNVVSANAESKAIIEGCYFANGTIRLGNYGASTKKSVVYIHGNSYTAQPYVVYEDPSTYDIENMEFIGWNNEIRQ